VDAFRLRDGSDNSNIAAADGTNCRRPTFVPSVWATFSAPNCPRIDAGRSVAQAFAASDREDSVVPSNCRFFPLCGCGRRERLAATPAAADASSPLSFSTPGARCRKNASFLALFTITLYSHFLDYPSVHRPLFGKLSSSPPIWCLAEGVLLGSDMGHRIAQIAASDTAFWEVCDDGIGSLAFVMDFERIRKLDLSGC
jgi:hypothetical protein